MPEVPIPSGLSLLPGETVLFVIRRHVIVLIVPLFFALVSALLLVTEACPAALALHLNGRCPPLVALFFLGTAAVFLGDWWTTRFILTQQRLIVLQQPVWLRVRSLRLSGIESLTARIGILGRLLGFGEIIADRTATEGGRLFLDFVPEPEALRERIAGAIAARASG